MGYFKRRREKKVLDKIRIAARVLREVDFDLYKIETLVNFYEAKRLLLVIQERAQNHLDYQINPMIQRIKKNEKQK